MDLQFPPIVLTLSLSRHDQAASNLGPDCVSALLKLGFQVKRQHGSHIISSTRSSIRTGNRARSLRTRHGHSTLNPPPSRNISERLQRLALQVLFTGLSRPSASLLPKLPAARSHSPFPGRSSARWCRPTSNTQPPCCPARVPWH